MTLQIVTDKQDMYITQIDLYYRGQNPRYNTDSTSVSTKSIIHNHIRNKIPGLLDKINVKKRADNEKEEIQQNKKKSNMIVVYLGAITVTKSTKLLPLPISVCKIRQTFTLSNQNLVKLIKYIPYEYKNNRKLKEKNTKIILLKI